MTVDPVDRAMRVRAGVVFPGPEWREDVYNEDTKRLELVQVHRLIACGVSRSMLLIMWPNGRPSGARAPHGIDVRQLHARRHCSGPYLVSSG